MVSEPAKSRVIGLTGNIACGKSAVAAILAELGLPIVDADRLSREATRPGGAVLPLIVNEFGTGVLDQRGALDRRVLRETVFGDATKRRKLEAILHPVIRARSEAILRDLAAQGHGTIVYEAPLLIESGRHVEMSGVLLVVCDPSIQRQRLRERSPELDADLVDRMLDSQLAQGEKRKVATWSIENNGSRDDLRAKCMEWHRRVVASPAQNS